MIDGDRDCGYTVTCDACGEECNENFDTFGEAVEFKKDQSNGWHSVKDGDGWEDICPDCWERLHNKE